jgi:hypothetical protein
MSTSDQSLPVPDWLPDWTDITAYPNKSDKNPRIWAWEFLRRNPEYQKMSEQIEALPPGPIHRDFSLESINERLERDFGLRIPAPPSMGSYDPDFKRRPLFVTHGRTWIRPVGWPDNATPYVVNELLCDPAEALVWVDLRWPFDRQLQAAKMFLRTKKQQLQKIGKLGKDRRLNTPPFLELLRLLDAEASDASNKTMAEIIYGIADEFPDHTGQQRVSEGLKRAKFLRDKGFRYLAMIIQG